MAVAAQFESALQSYHIKKYRGIMAKKTYDTEMEQSYHIKKYRGIMAGETKYFRDRKSYHIKKYRGIMASVGTVKSKS